VLEPAWERARAGRGPDACFAMQVGGLTIGVRSTSPDLRLNVTGCAERFLVAPGDHDLELEAEWRRLAAEPPGPLVFDSGGAWRLHEASGRHVFRVFDSRLGAVPYKEARLEPGGARGVVALDPSAHAPDEPVDVLQFPLDELLFLRLLAARDGVELHACGVVAPSGRGYLLAGHSGDGKTTSARLWAGLPGAQVLSDDRIVVRREAGRWWMYGTPWHGEARLAANARAPLAAALILARGEGEALEPLAPAEAVSALLARGFVPLHDSPAVSATLTLLERLAREVTCRRFRFRPGPAALRAVFDGL
jgi:hypothetical protein